MIVRIVTDACFFGLGAVFGIAGFCVLLHREFERRRKEEEEVNE